MITVTEGDIVIAPFGFAESEDKKLRPCLVWAKTPVSITLIYISSQKVATAFPTEVVLSEEEARTAGLERASRIDFGKRYRCLPVDVKKVAGALSALPRRKLIECSHAADAAGLLD